MCVRIACGTASPSCLCAECMLTLLTFSAHVAFRDSFVAPTTTVSLERSRVTRNPRPEGFPPPHPAHHRICRIDAIPYSRLLLSEAVVVSFLP